MTNARRLLIASLAALCVLVLWSAPALALQEHVLSGSIGETGSGKGQFKDPVAIALNTSTELSDPQAGDIYIADGGNGRVERFSAAGAYLGQFNGTGTYEVEGKTETGAAAPTGQFLPHEKGIAVDNSDNPLDPSRGDVYVLDSANNVVDKFSPTGAYEGQLSGNGICATPGACSEIEVPFERPIALAVDSAGDLLVAEMAPFDGQQNGPYQETIDGAVSEFGDTGSFIKRLRINRYIFEINGVEVNRGHQDPATPLWRAGFALDTAGNFYTIAQSGPAKINPNTEEAEYSWGYVNGNGGAETELSDKGYVGEGVFGLAVNPSTNRVLFARPSGKISEYALEGELSATPIVTFGLGDLSEWANASQSPASGAGQDLAVSDVGTVYATERAGNKVLFFDQVVVPDVSSEAASKVSETTAKLNATVGPSGQPVTACEFEYVSEAAFKADDVNAVQSLTLAGATGGDYTISFRSVTTAPIAYDASAGEVQSALAALSSIGAGHVQVKGGEGNPYTVEFSGPLGHAKLPLLVADSSGLTPGGASVTPAVVSEGGDGWGAAAAAPCSPEAGQISVGDEAVPVSATATGLSPDTSYDFRMHAADAQGPNTSETQSFTTVSTLVVGGDAYSGAGPGSVTMAAEINPGGRAVEYHFEYGTNESYGSVTPTVEIEHGYSTVRVHTQVSGLDPETLYHFRVVVSDEEPGVQDGADVTFRTFPAAYSTPPDGRIDELVTPVANDEANVDLNEQWPEIVGAAVELPFRAAADGEAVAYESAPTVGGNGNNGNAIVATRDPAGGWRPVTVGPQGIPFGVSFTDFSNNVTTGTVASPTPLTPGGPGGRGPNGEETTGYYLWKQGVSGYQPLPGAWVGESADGSHQLVELEGRLYEVAEGVASPVGVLPDGQMAAASKPPQLRFKHQASHGWISSDGSRVIWSNGEGGLYLRDMSSGETVQLDAGQGGSGNGGGIMWTASADASKVFFIDEEQLTSDSTAGGEAHDLYECEMAHSAGKLTCELRDLTVHAGETAGVLGVLGASEDGEYVYFVAQAALASGAQPQECERFGASGCNLYLSHDGETRFVAVLQSHTVNGDSSDWEANPDGTAEVSASGSLVFDSRQSLTGYDNMGAYCENTGVNATGPGPCNEIYLYQPGGGGHLFCTSCSPSGEPPIGTISSESSLPPNLSSLYQMRWISEDGDQVFFDSAERLVARDTNGRQDVYEWERDGSGSCKTEPGCIYLLSSGTGTSGSYLLDASADGGDVFIVSRSALVEEGQSNDYAVYDARVGGTRVLSPPTCTGTGCQGIPSPPPTFATPPSVTFEGVGNFAAPTPTPVVVKPKPAKCKKGFVKKGGKCVKQRKAHKRATKAKKAKKSAKGRK